MPTTEDRNQSKSSRRIKIKSPFSIRHKISQGNTTKQKLSMGKSHGSTNDSTESNPKAFGALGSKNALDSFKGKNYVSTQSFKNKILVSSCEFNRLKEKLKTSPGTLKGQTCGQNNKKTEKRVKIRIIDRMSKKSSNPLDNTNTNNTTGSNDSEEVEMLKIENEYFKKIYDEALGELSKLKNKLKEEKKVHNVEKQIYQTQLNKLKRIVDSEREEVSHIICDQENKCIIMVSEIMPYNDEGTLGLDSDCEDSIGNISIESK